MTNKIALKSEMKAHIQMAKSSLQAFAVAQLEKEEDLPLTDNNGKSSDNKTLFFQWWYFGICCGSLLGVSVMSYVQDNFGWGLGFTIPTLTMVASIFTFSFGNRCYIQRQGNIDNDKSFIEIFQTIKACDELSHEYTLVELELQQESENSCFEQNPNQS